MTKEEFMSLSVGGLQRLHNKLTGKLSLSRNKPALRVKLEPLAWADVAFTDIVPPPDPEDEEKPAKVTKPKAAAKPAPKPATTRKVKSKKKAAAKVKATGGEQGATVKLITSMHKDGKSLREIKAHLEKKGLRTARGSKTWWPSSIQSALGQRW
jgi:outer membrane biosynthesis protein TonB